MNIKKTLFYLILFKTLLIFPQVGIGTTNPDPSSILHLESSNKGLLLPRVANTSAIISPVEGLIVYDISTTCVKVYENGGWSDCLTSGGSSNVTADCNVNGFSGQYINGVALSGTEFTITITNNSLSTITLNFLTTDLNLSGVSGITVSGVSPATATLNGGDVQQITYTLTGTPSSSGTLQGDWSKATLSCSASQLVIEGSATFPKLKNNVYVFSVNDVSLPLNQQGVFTTGTIINVPYENGLGSYIAYTSSDVSIPAIYCEDGASDWTFSYSYSAGVFSTTGDISITLVTKKGGAVTNWTAKRVSNITTINFDAVAIPWIVNGVTFSNTVGIDEGGDAIRGALSTSGAAYDAAAVNDIVRITQAEYDNISNIVPLVVTVGKQSITDGAGGLGAMTWTQNGNGTTWKNFPSNSYICSFAYAHNTGNASTYYRMGCASSTTGGVIPMTNYSGPFSTSNQVYYFYAVKRPSIHCSVNTLITSSATADMGGRGFGSGSNAYTHTTPSAGGIPTPSNTSLSGSWTPTVQVKSSTQKSW